MSANELLSAGLRDMALGLPAEAGDKLLAYLALLGKWNRVYNLTAVRDENEMVTHHLLDSLAVLPHLEGVVRLADIGSGAGLPGIPLAIGRPEMQVVSIEANQKKAAFQQQAKIELGLANFEVRCARVETAAQDLKVDAAISRAFSSLADFVRLAGGLLGEGGRLLAMKGVVPGDEIAELPEGWRVLATTALAVPGLDAQRHLIVLGRG